jgi:hypothetical protein
MSQTDLPLSFWGYALENVVFTLNRVPTKSVERTPYEIWTGRHPRLSFLKVWDVCLMSNILCHTSSLQNQTNVSLWGIRVKPKDIIFIIKMREKCLSLAMVSSWRKSFSLKELVGARCNLKKFNKQLKMFQHPLISIRARRVTKKFTLLTTEQCDILLLGNDEPMTYIKAMMGPNSEKYLEAR